MTPDFESDLTLQQQMFVAEYAVHFDGKKAALTAGYSEKTAQTQSYQLLQIPKIQKAISITLQGYGTKHEVLKQRVVNELTNMAFSDITDMYDKAQGTDLVMTDLMKLERSKRKMIKELKVKRKTFSGPEGDSMDEEVTIKLWSKEKALEMLGKHLGMFIDTIPDIPPPPYKAPASLSSDDSEES